MSEAVFDEGLQPERTLLAWRRTCLSFAIASILLARYALERFGFLAVILGLAAAGLSVAAYVMTSAAYRRVHESLLRDGRTGRGGLPFLLATLGALTVGASAAVCIAVAAVSR